MIIINPGTGDTEDYGFEQAYNNIIQFIKECEVKDLKIISMKGIPDYNGRYSFKINSFKYGMTWDIEMPALPIDEVRYVQGEQQNIWDFPRLYVDGSSWLWCFAIIGKEDLIEGLEYRLDEAETKVEELKKLLEENEEVTNGTDKE